MLLEGLWKMGGKIMMNFSWTIRAGWVKIQARIYSMTAQPKALGIII